MALRSLLRKAPALAGALRSPAAHAPSPLPRLKSPSFQALAPSAGARSMSQAPDAAAGHTVYTGVVARKEIDRVHAEIMQTLEIIGQDLDEIARLEAEYWARRRRQLDTIEQGCHVVIIVLSVASLALQVIWLM